MQIEGYVNNQAEVDNSLQDYSSHHTKAELNKYI